MGMGGSSYSGSYNYEHRRKKSQPSAYTYTPPVKSTTAPRDDTAASNPWDSVAPRTESRDEGSGKERGVRVREEFHPGLEEKTSMAQRLGFGDGSRDRVPGGDGWGTAKATESDRGTRPAASEEVEEEEQNKEKVVGWMKSAVGGVVNFWKKKTYEKGKYGTGGG